MNFSSAHDNVKEFPPSLSQTVFTSCCMQLPSQRVGESRRKMRGEERSELQLPNRE